MFIEFVLPQDNVDGELIAYDLDGKPVKVSRVIYKPYFFTSTAIPTVMFASLFPGDPGTKEAAKPTQRAAVVVSGTKNRLRFMDRTKPVLPQCEVPSTGKSETKKS
jgi:hypothetical protein